MPDDYLPDPQLVGKHTEYKNQTVTCGNGRVKRYNLVDRFTGYLVTEVVLTKKAGKKDTKTTKRLVAKMAKALG